MRRYIAKFPILAFTLSSFAVGCGGRDQTSTTSTSAGATPTVSAVSTAPDADAEAEITAPVTYAAAESAFGAARFPEAVEGFTAYTGTHPENPWGHYMLGMSAWRTGDHEKAVSAFDRALELDPSHRKSLFNSSRVLLETGRAKEALDRIEQALALEPMSNEGIRLLGRARYELGQVEEAVQAYRRALSLDERDVWSMNNLGLIYIQQGRSTDAIRPLARAVELRSNSPVFQNNLGTALERSGYPTAAAQAYEAAIAADSTYAKASTGLARVTGGAQQPESVPVDLAGLSQEFQLEIESWRGATTSSDSVAPVVTETDSSSAVTDSILMSGGEVTDTSEECESGHDL